MTSFLINPYRFAPAGPTDPSFASVSLLLHGDGANGSTAITDSSGSPKTVTAVGNAQISTAQSKFGGTSILFDGVNDYATVSTSSAFTFGTGDFTVEAWVRESARSGYPTALEIGNHQNNTGVIFLMNDGNAPNNCIGLYSGGFFEFTKVAAPAFNTWNHVAWVRASGVLKIYLNGVGSSGSAFTNNLSDSTTVTIGSKAGGDGGGANYDLNGYIQELRITNGVARYSANFTPPTAPFPNTAPADPDAQAYLAAVEAADGQALETGVRDAINLFVLGCKADSTWDAIKASCILAGARTLAGALVPLKGTAPTNSNFVSGDYNRKTGLIGNGTTKYLNSNRLSGADPQNNAHIAVYQSAAASASGSVFMTHIGTADASGYVSHIAEGFPGGSDLKLRRLRSDSAVQAGVTKTSTNNANGLQGCSRSTSSAFTYRAGLTDTSITNTSVSQGSLNYFVLAQNNTDTVANHSNARIAFYSIGESLDLSLLDSRVSTLINSIAATIASQNYIATVEAADGASLETGVKDAIYQLVYALIEPGVWAAAGQLLLPCGPRTLAGALVPLKGTAPTNNGFVSGDYNRKTGLGDTSNTSKWLNSNVLQNSLGASSHALAWYGSITEATGDRILLGHFNDGTVNATALLTLDAWASFASGRAFRSAAGLPGQLPVTTSSAAVSCLVGSRTAANAAALYADGSSFTNTTSVSSAFESRSLYWFALRLASTTTGVANSRSLLQVGGIFTSGLNATQAAAFRSASSAYVSAIAAAIP
jgi:hypothetical protein